MTRWRIWLLVMNVVVSVGALRLNGQTGDGGGLASTAPAAYPLAAKAAGIEGNVVVKGVIGKDGTMRDVRAVKGPQELRQAAVDAVMRWVYHPYFHNGSAVDVETTITVNFSMGDKKKKVEEQAKAKAQAELAKAASDIPAAVPK